MENKIYTLKDGRFIALEDTAAHAERLGITPRALQQRHVRKRIEGIPLRGIYYLTEPGEQTECT